MENFEHLYILSKKITEKLDGFLTLSINNIITPEDSEHQTIIEEIKKLVLMEYELVDKLTQEEIEDYVQDLKTIIEENFKVSSEYDLTTYSGLESCLRALSSLNTNPNSLYDPDILLRAFDRIKNKTYILDGEGVSINLNVSGNNVINYKVCIWDIITSALNIEVLKKLNTKIYSLIPAQPSDTKFISRLKRNLKASQINILFSTFTSEIMALYAGNNLDKIKIADVEKLKQLENCDPELYKSLLYEEAKSHADTLASTEEIDNNPEEVFEFLLEVTSFEIIINHMDKENLKYINDYCEEISTNQNKACMSGITSFIKRKIKRKNDQQINP